MTLNCVDVSLSLEKITIMKQVKLVFRLSSKCETEAVERFLLLNFLFILSFLEWRFTRRKFSFVSRSHVNAFLSESSRSLHVGDVKIILSVALRHSIREITLHELLLFLIQCAEICMYFSFAPYILELKMKSYFKKCFLKYEKPFYNQWNNCLAKFNASLINR